MDARKVFLLNTGNHRTCFYVMVTEPMERVIMQKRQGS